MRREQPGVPAMFLDLDNTLVGHVDSLPDEFAALRGRPGLADFRRLIVSVYLPAGLMRPHVPEFLLAARRAGVPMFVFTLRDRAWAEFLRGCIEEHVGGGFRFLHVFTRSSAVLRGGVLVKTPTEAVLRKVAAETGRRDWQLVLVDDIRGGFPTEVTCPAYVANEGVWRAGKCVPRDVWFRKFAAGLRR